MKHVKILAEIVVEVSDDAPTDPQHYAADVLEWMALDMEEAPLKEGDERVWSFVAIRTPDNDKPLPPPGLRPKRGVLYGCGKADCRECYETAAEWEAARGEQAS